NKHGLKKIKHALLSSQETITLPVQAPEPCGSRLLFRGRLLRCVFTLSGVPFPVESAVSVFLIGVKARLCFFRLCVFACRFERWAFEATLRVYMLRAPLEPGCFEEDVCDRGPVPSANQKVRALSVPQRLFRV
ncbi:hypothetical protein, partial [Nocardiopsis sp. NPDC006832]|uniref:hypothetical protein n=1 Tax=Nocardiopsis sp. NPDC006832 TaxID=3157188 RepID=UPI0033F265AA